MTVSFPNPATVSTVWIPMLKPSTSTVVSTVVALTFLTLLLTAVTAFFAVFCMERLFTWKRTLVTLAVIAVGLGALAMGTGRLTDAHDAQGVLPATSRTAALTSAQTAAPSPHGWTAEARETKYDGTTLQSGWTKTDLHTLSLAVAKAKGYTEAHSNSSATIDSVGMTDEQVAQHGTGYLDGSKLMRCAVRLGQVKRNNAGQPTSASLDAIHCVTAATTS